MSDTFDRVVKIISEQLDLNEDKKITEDTSILGDLGADSLEVMEIVMAMEEEFGIKLPDNEVTNLKTVGDVVSAIDNLIEG